MSEKRLTLFPKELYVDMLDKQGLLNILLKNDFLEPDPQDKKHYVLTSAFMLLLDQTEVKLSPSYHVRVWIEYFDEPTIQIGADSQDIKSVKTPDSKKSIGDLTLAYQLIEELHKNIEAKWTDQETQTEYHIRDLDFSHYLAIGKYFIQLDGYLKPTQAFLDKLSTILQQPFSYANYWL